MKKKIFYLTCIFYFIVFMTSGVEAEISYEKSSDHRVCIITSYITMYKNIEIYPWESVSLSKSIKDDNESYTLYVMSNERRIFLNSSQIKVNDTSYDMESAGQRNFGEDYKYVGISYTVPINVVNSLNSDSSVTLWICVLNQPPIKWNVPQDILKEWLEVIKTKEIQGKICTALKKSRY